MEEIMRWPTSAYIYRVDSHIPFFDKEKEKLLLDICMWWEHETPQGAVLVEKLHNQEEQINSREE